MVPAEIRVRVRDEKKEFTKELSLCHRATILGLADEPIRQRLCPRDPRGK
jgi:hypothetical protein